MFFLEKETGFYKTFNFLPDGISVYIWGNVFEICLDCELDMGYPRRIGSISNYGYGRLHNSIKISYYINDDFRNIGIISKLLKEYVSHFGSNTYELAIKENNQASIAVARKNGFTEYDKDFYKDEKVIFFKLEK